MPSPPLIGDPAGGPPGEAGRQPQAGVMIGDQRFRSFHGAEVDYFRFVMAPSDVRRGRCHASSDLRSVWRLDSECYAENQLRRLPLPAGDYTPSDMVVS